MLYLNVDMLHIDKMYVHSNNQHYEDIDEQAKERFYWLFGSYLRHGEPIREEDILTPK